MKKYIIILFSLIYVSVCNAQIVNDSTVAISDSIIVNQDSVALFKEAVIVPKTLEERLDSMIEVNNAILEQIETDLSLKNRYKLYQTENIYTLLQLDTKTGRIEQVQWSLDEDNEGTFYINSRDLTSGDGYGSGSFELYPTQNMYQFILLDKTDGRKWHVQWGLSSSKRWIRRIY